MDEVYGPLPEPGRRHLPGSAVNCLLAEWRIGCTFILIAGAATIPQGRNMFTHGRALVSVAAVAWLGLSAVAQSQGAGPAANGQPPEGMQTAVLFDPAVGVNAYTITYPAKWNYQAMLWQGSPCDPISAPVFRVSSPDGLSVVERMPPFGWSWGSDAASSRPKQGCLDVHETVSAKDFVKYMSSMLQVEYVGDDSVPRDAAERYQASFDRLNAQSEQIAANGGALTHQWGDIAVAKIRFKNGTYPMEGRVSATIGCIGNRTRTFRGQPVETDRCQATVAYLYAPEAQFAALWAERPRIGAQPIPGYIDAWRAALQRQTQQVIALSQAQMAASQQNFANQQAAQLQAHNQFLATMQAGTDASMARAAQIANTQHTIASDYVDYALGQQTYRNPATGQATKVAAGSAVTWLSADGRQSYQAPDPNANPNGVLPGTWNRGQQTHGDGSPYP
jgi:hypothetical protein